MSEKVKTVKKNGAFNTPPLKAKVIMAEGLNHVSVFIFSSVHMQLYLCYWKFCFRNIYSKIQILVDIMHGYFLFCFCDITCSLIFVWLHLRNPFTLSTPYHVS